MRGEMFSLLRERRREASIPTEEEEEEEEEEERTELTIGEERGSSSSTEERGNFKPAGLLVERRETGELNSARLNFWSLKEIGSCCRLWMSEKRYYSTDTIIGVKAKTAEERTLLE